MAQHNITGQWGEDVACENLIIKGYTICERNYRIGHYELDIVAMKGNRIAFIEVKTRTYLDSDPLDAINGKKILRMVRAANTYIKQHNIPHEVQFDVVSIVGTPDNYLFEHIPDAFFAPLTTR